MERNYDTRQMWKYATRSGRIAFHDREQTDANLRLIRRPESKTSGGFVPPAKPAIQPAPEARFGEDHED